jgi:hypothetical protein
MIEVREGHLGLGVYATQPISPRQFVIEGWGPPAPCRTRHSIQVDSDRHIIIESPIQFLNHSCEPNCGVLIRLDEERLELHALRWIEPGEELTIDYATFEDEILHMEPPCRCGAAACRGRIVGYKGLPAERREALGPYIAGHLRALDPAFEEVSQA